MLILMEFPTLMGPSTRWVGFYSSCYYGVEAWGIPIGWAHLLSPLLVFYGFKLRAGKVSNYRFWTGVRPKVPGSIPASAILQCGEILSVAVRIVAVRIVTGTNFSVRIGTQP